RYSSQAKHPLAQQMLSQTFDKLSLSGKETALRHSETQRRQYASELAGARAALAQENTALNYNDDDLFEDNINEARQATHMQAQLDGLAPGDLAYKQKMKDAVSGVYSARIQTMLATGDPATIVKASEYMKEGYDKGDISLKTSLALRQ